MSNYSLYSLKGNLSRQKTASKLKQKSRDLRSYPNLFLKSRSVVLLELEVEAAPRLKGVEGERPAVSSTVSSTLLVLRVQGILTRVKLLPHFWKDSWNPGGTQKCQWMHLFDYMTETDVRNIETSRWKSSFWPGSVRTSLAEAMSINLFSASFLSDSPWKLSGCHCWASFLYALMISCLLASLRKSIIIWGCVLQTIWSTMDGFSDCYQFRGRHLWQWQGTCLLPGSYSSPSCGRPWAFSELVPALLLFRYFRCQILSPPGSPPQLQTWKKMKKFV